MSRIADPKTVSRILTMQIDIERMRREADRLLDRVEMLEVTQNALVRSELARHGIPEAEMHLYNIERPDNNGDAHVIRKNDEQEERVLVDEGGE